MDLTWLIIIITVFFVISLTGWLTSRNLPEPDKSVRFRKFHAVGTVIFLCYFVFAAPIVTSISFISSKDYEYPRDLATIEVVAKQTQEQHQRLERLEIEVKRLREDIYQQNRHYSFLLVPLLTGLTGFFVNSAFFNKKDTT